MTKYLIGASFLALFACAQTGPSQAQQSTVVATCGAQSIPTSQGTSGTFIAADGSLCTSGSGGGGGGGAVYGPNANGVAASHPPVIIGGTVDGTGTGAVQNAMVDAGGNLSVTPTSLGPGAATSANQTLQITDLDAIKTNTATTATNSALPLPAQSGHVLIGAVEGDAASGASVAGNPLLDGGRAATAAPTAVTDGQAVAKQLTPEGRTVTAPYAIKELMVRGTVTSTDTGAHTIIASAGGSLKNYITGLQCGRTDAGATAIVLTLSDAASTVVILPSGGATNIQFTIPLATAAATAFSVTSGTSVSTLYCSAQGFTGL